MCSFYEWNSLQVCMLQHPVWHPTTSISNRAKILEPLWCRLLQLSCNFASHFTSLHTFVVVGFFRDLPFCLRILLGFHLVVVVSLLMADSVREREENRSGSRPRCASQVKQLFFQYKITHASRTWTFMLVKKYARVRAANCQYKSLHFIL